MISALRDYSEDNLTDIAKRIGISRGHLYRLARKDSKIREAYRMTHAVKDLLAKMRFMPS